MIPTFPLAEVAARWVASGIAKPAQRLRCLSALGDASREPLDHVVVAQDPAVLGA
jgi:hypothetical protein